MIVPAQSVLCPLIGALTVKMKISIIHPSRGRPEQALQTAYTWYKKADIMPEYILVLDRDDPTCIEYKDLATIKILDKHRSAVEAINHGASLATGELFIVVSDDFNCPAHWDTLLVEALEGKTDFCVKTKDGFQSTLITLPIMDRTYYNRFGYIYNPVYKHWYADQEMTAVAHMLGKVVNVDMLFTHNHYLAGKGTKDAINERNNLSAASGKLEYGRRVRDNFGIENPVMPYNQIRWR